MIIISKDSDYHFHVRTKRLSKDKRHEATEKISEFKEKVENGEVDLRTVFQNLSDTELKMLESVRQKLELLGE